MTSVKKTPSLLFKTKEKKTPSIPTHSKREEHPRFLCITNVKKTLSFTTRIYDKSKEGSGGVNADPNLHKPAALVSHHSAGKKWRVENTLCIRI